MLFVHNFVVEQIKPFFNQKCSNSRGQFKSFTEILRSCRVGEDEKCNVISLLDQVGLFDSFLESSVNLSTNLSQNKVAHPLLTSGMTTSNLWFKKNFLYEVCHNNEHCDLWIIHRIPSYTAKSTGLKSLISSFQQFNSTLSCFPLHLNVEMGDSGKP